MAENTIPKAETSRGFAEALYALSPEIRLTIAKQLKVAGLYRGKPTNKFNSTLLDALNRLEEKKALLGSFDPNIKAMGRYDFIAGLEPEDSGKDGSGTNRNQSQTYIYSATQSAKVLDSVSKELLGRELTRDEKKRYTSLLTKAQRANPSRTTGIGTGAQTTQGGVDEQQFLTEKISSTSEAKTSRANDAYSILMEELGGLR